LDSKKIQILIVDDNLPWRNTLQLSFSTLPGIEIIDAVQDGQEALRVCSSMRPDVVILDIDMPGMDGFQTARALLKIYPDLWILGVSTDVTEADQKRARESGLRTIVPKDMILDYLPVSPALPNTLFGRPTDRSM
jgi:CheY-like chemotaxis protein